MKGCTFHFWEVAGTPFYIQGGGMFISTSLCLLNFIMFIVYRHNSQCNLFIIIPIIIFIYYQILLFRYEIVSDNHGHTILLYTHSHRTLTGELLNMA